MCRVYDEGFEANMAVVDQSSNIYRDDVFHFLIYSGSVFHTWLARSRAISEVERGRGGNICVSSFVKTKKI